MSEKRLYNCWYRLAVPTSRGGTGRPSLHAARERVGLQKNDENHVGIYAQSRGEALKAYRRYLFAKGVIGSPTR